MRSQRSSRATRANVSANEVAAVGVQARWLRLPVEPQPHSSRPCVCPHLRRVGATSGRWGPMINMTRQKSMRERVRRAQEEQQYVTEEEETESINTFEYAL